MVPLSDFNTAANTAQTQQPDTNQQADLFEAEPTKGSSMTDPLISVADPSMQKIVDHHGSWAYVKHVHLPDDADRVCPYCGAKGHKDERKSCKLRHTPVDGLPTFVVVHFHRMYCPVCQKKWSQRTSTAWLVTT